MSETKQEWLPQAVSDIDLAFPAQVSHLMPAYDDIPREFKNGHTKWNKFFGDMFFSGLKNAKLVAKDGIDGTQAARHIRAISGSFEPKHEHKEAAVAYLMSLWFDDSSTWERAK